MSYVMCETYFELRLLIKNSGL